MNTQRGSQRSLRRLVLPAAICALALAASCGGGTGGNAGSIGDGGGTETLDAPTLTTINPETGVPEGGTPVTLTGSGFLTDVVGQTAVTIGGVPATDVVVLNDTTITALTPAGDNDLLAEIKVSNSRGNATLANGFHFLATIHIISDLNDDGLPDLVVSAAYDGTGGALAGAVHVFFGSEEVMLTSLTAGVDSGLKLVGAAPNDRFGSTIATGDVNDDGVIDLLVGSPRADQPASDAGSVRVFFGPLDPGMQLDATDADIVLTGEGSVPGDLYGSTGDNFGATLSLGDVDGDGVLDILVGAPTTDLDPNTSAELEDAGRAYLFLGGPSLASRSALDADVILSGELDSANFGSAVCLVDIDGDGRSDLAVAGQVESPVLYIGGYVHVFNAVGLVHASASQADLRLDGETGGDEFGSALSCGKINGDDVEDLVVGAPYTDTLGSATGRVYVFFGSSNFGSRDASLADVIYSGQPSNTEFGVTLAVADMNGDLYDDVLVGAPRTSFGAQKNGRVFVFFGAVQPMDELSHFSDVIYTGEEIDGERFGSSVEVLDCDGDGIADMMSAALGHDQAAGRVYVFRGQDQISDTQAVDDDMTLTGESEGGNFGFSISRGK